MSVFEIDELGLEIHAYGRYPRLLELALAVAANQ
jgi:hypothetical protein